MTTTKRKAKKRARKRRAKKKATGKRGRSTDKAGTGKFAGWEVASDGEDDEAERVAEEEATRQRVRIRTAAPMMGASADRCVAKTLV